MMRMTSTALLCVLVSACGGGQSEAEEPQFADANDPDYAASFDGTIDPRVSTSRGEEGGVVLLFPRVIPSDGAEAVQEQAAAIQERLRGLVENALPGRPIDQRPAPERVCPRAGCVGIAVGAVLVHSGAGCAVVATVSRPGESASGLEPWTPATTVRSAVIPFREHPESQIAVRDYARCAELLDSLSERDDAVTEQIRLAGSDEL